MATPTTVQVKMQLRFDTAANWTSVNPTLLNGEMGLETTTNKIKIGDGTTAWNSLGYFPFVVSGGTVTGNLEIGSTGTLTFEGSTANDFETTLGVVDPTADRTITLPDQSGTVVVTGNASIVDADIAANAEIAVSKLANGAANQVIVTDGTNVSWSSDLTLAGNLTVNGTTTTVNTETLTVKDKNIELAVVDTPTDVTADGGGITLKGATDKTINWIDATDAWTSSERFSVPLGSDESPSLTFTGDENTGIYSPGADQLALSTSGAEALRINADGDILVADGNRMEIDEIRARDGAGLKLFDDAGAGIFVQDGGSVGIGTSSPGTTLDVRGAANSHQLHLGNISNRGLNISTALNSSSRTDCLTVFSSGDINGEFAFETPGTRYMTITSLGRVGIGTTSPGALLHLQQSTGATYFRLTADSATVNGDQTIDIQAIKTGVAYHDLRLDGNSHIYRVQGTERARIDSSGRLLVGTVSSPAYKLQLETDSAGKPSTNTWTIVSDERIKEEIELADLDLCYEAVKNIPLKRFKWKDEVYTEEQAYDRRKLGWIAQDVEAVFPKAVRQHEFKYNQVFEEVVIPAVPAELDDDGNIITEEQPERIEKGELISEEVIEDCRDLNSDQLYAAMYGAIQKLISKVELLEAEVQALKAA